MKKLHSSFLIPHSSRSRAFTLIEMLVVIGIIALLSGIILVSLNSSRAKARDAKRISDIAQIQLSLEQYFDRCQQYPANITDLTAPCATNSSITLGTFISKIPTPPSGGSVTQTAYDYAVNTTGYGDFVLHATFEGPNVATKDGLHAAPSWASSFNCDDSSASLDYCVGTK